MKAPVAWAMKPVVSGARMPAKLPPMFWMPIQRPPAEGPARVWPMEKISGLPTPVQIPARTRQGMASPLGPSPSTSSARPPPAMAITSRMRRTPALPEPREIKASVAQPLARAERACRQNTAPPIQAMAVSDRCSALTR